MAPDLFTADLANFLESAIEIQFAEPEKPLIEKTLREIARNAGLTEEDWENLCEKLKGHLAKGRNFLKFANYSEAISELEAAAAIAPYRADVLVDCGKAHFGRWKEAGTRSSRDRAESLFRKSLEIDPDNADAAEQLSSLKKAKPVPRISRKKMAVMAAFLLLAGGVSAWVGIPGPSGKMEPVAVDVGIGSPSPAPPVFDPVGRTVYPPATLPSVGSPGPLAFERDLVAHWTFDGASPGEDSAAGRHPLTKGGRIDAVEGIDGRAMRFFSDAVSGMYAEPSPQLELVDSFTVSAWVKPLTRRGGQVFWFGDKRVGRDPCQLFILANGQVRFRTDRSVTGSPTFRMMPNEIVVTPGGVPHLNQHIMIDSPGVLPLNEWSFITGRIQKTSSGESIITVFVNGSPVGEVKTAENVDYDTDKMQVTIGAVHDGSSQNFNGVIDEVRVYRSALSDEEIREIYRHPRRNGEGAEVVPLP